MLGAAVIAMGLLAGLIYDWAITVMPALTAADDRTLVDAMQQTVDNPAFPLTFLAAGALAAVALVQARRSGSPETARWILAGLAFYTLTVLITAAIHLPLNEDLKNAGDPARIEISPPCATTSRAPGSPGTSSGRWRRRRPSARLSGRSSCADAARYAFCSSRSVASITLVRFLCARSYSRAARARLASEPDSRLRSSSTFCSS